MHDELVMRIARTISDELSLHKQGLQWDDVDGPIQRTAIAVIGVVASFMVGPSIDYPSVTDTKENAEK